MFRQRRTLSSSLRKSSELTLSRNRLRPGRSDVGLSSSSRIVTCPPSYVTIVALLSRSLPKVPLLVGGTIGAVVPLAVSTPNRVRRNGGTPLAKMCTVSCYGVLCTIVRLRR